MRTHVLLVDDNEDCRIIYGSTLRHAGYTVELAVNGEECVEQARANPPGLILLDLGMPRMDGRAAIRKLKADPATADIPVVAVSARVNLDQRRETLDDGFTDVLLKPLTPADVLATVERLLPRPAN